ncbi:MAG: DUF1569 domain-containing protein [Flavobacteriaceae bacterium]
MKNIFDQNVAQEFIKRIENLTPESQAQWGKMSVSQMLAHCCVAYEMVYTDKHPEPNAFVKLLLKLFVKKAVVSEQPYPRNGRTGPQFIIRSEKDFNEEKTRLIDYILKTAELGEAHFDDKQSHSMGKLSAKEWNNSFAKHLEHHLAQFGV